MLNNKNFIEINFLTEWRKDKKKEKLVLIIVAFLVVFVVDPTGDRVWRPQPGRLLGDAKPNWAGWARREPEFSTILSQIEREIHPPLEAISEARYVSSPRGLWSLPSLFSSSFVRGKKEVQPSPFFSPSKCFRAYRRTCKACIEVCYLQSNFLVCGYIDKSLVISRDLIPSWINKETFLFIT